MFFITSDTDLVLQDKIQSLYFYASWMPYHKKMLVMLDKMEDKYPNIDFIGIDIDFFKTFIKRFKIDSIPTVLLINNGKEIKRLNGLVLTSAIKSTFADICKI